MGDHARTEHQSGAIIIFFIMGPLLVGYMRKREIKYDFCSLPPSCFI